MKNILRIICVLSVCLNNFVLGYTFYNQSEDPSDIITVVGFKNEKKAMMFMEQMGWTGEVEKVSDYAAAGSHFLPVLMLPPFCIATPMIFVTPRIAEALIRARFVICEHRNLWPKKVWEAAGEKIQKKERHSASWNWLDIKRDKGIADIYFLVFRKYERSLSSVDSILGATKPGEKYRTEIVAAGFCNRSAGITYKGAGQALQQKLPFVKAIYKPLVNTQKIPSNKVNYMTFAKGVEQGMLLYEYRVGTTMQKMSAIEQDNQPISVTPEKAAAIIQKEYDATKEELKKEVTD